MCTCNVNRKMKKQIPLFAVLFIPILSCLITPGTSLSNDGIISSFGTISYNNITTTTFGVQVWWQNDYNLLDDQMQMVADLGVKWVRIDIHWNELEPVKGTYKWWRNGDGKDWDTQVNLTKQFGMEPLIVFCSPPSWEWTPTDFANMVSAAVTRYEPKAIELWNEPAYFETLSEQKLVDSVEEAYQAVKAIDSDIKVGLGWGTGECNYCTHNSKYSLTHLYDLGVKDYLDAIVIHPYTWDTEPEVGKSYWPNYPNGITGEIQYLRDFLESRGDANREIWATEFGYNAGWHSAEEQADWTVSAAQILVDESIEKIIYYSFWADDGWKIVENDLTPRPVYYAYQEFIQSKTQQ